MHRPSLFSPVVYTIPARLSTIFSVKAPHIFILPGKTTSVPEVQEKRRYISWITPRTQRPPTPRPPRTPTPRTRRTPKTPRTASNLPRFAKGRSLPAPAFCVSITPAARAVFLPRRGSSRGQSPPRIGSNAALSLALQGVRGANQNLRLSRRFGLAL